MLTREELIFWKISVIAAILKTYFFIIYSSLVIRRMIVRWVFICQLTRLYSGTSTVHRSEVGWPEVSIGELTKTTGQFIPVDQPVVDDIGEVRVNSTSVALRNVVRHNTIWRRQHHRVRVSAYSSVSIESIYSIRERHIHSYNKRTSCGC